MSEQRHLSGRDGRLVIYLLSTAALFGGLVLLKMPVGLSIALIVWALVTLSNCAADLADLAGRLKLALRDLDESRKRATRFEQERDRALAELAALARIARTPAPGGLAHLFKLGFGQGKSSVNGNGVPSSGTSH